jgi:hypothetical protein
VCVVLKLPSYTSASQGLWEDTLIQPWEAFTGALAEVNDDSTLQAKQPKGARRQRQRWAPLSDLGWLGA